MQTLQLSEELPQAKSFHELYQSVGWKNPFTEQGLIQAISQSWYYLSLYDNQELVGFGRILSDGIYQAMICDLMVHPGYQGKGCGTILLHRLLHKCREAGMVKVFLFCAEGKAEFYKKFGFVPRPKEAPGMEWVGEGDSSSLMTNLLNTAKSSSNRCY
jgi:GNAT superfamily N-acetyltransferase